MSLADSNIYSMPYWVLSHLGRKKCPCDIMADPISINELPMISFKCRHFPTEVILQCVRWYCAYALSYRNIEEMVS